MICPKCKNEIESVNVFSECYQRAELKGNKIVEYGSVEEILDDINDIECPKCQASIKDDIES